MDDSAAPAEEAEFRLLSIEYLLAPSKLFSDFRALTAAPPSPPERAAAQSAPQQPAAPTCSRSE